MTTAARRGSLTAPPSSSTPTARGDYDIWSISPTGTGLAQLTNTNDQDGFPVFKPDSTKIGFIRGNEFWTMNPDGTSQTRITQVYR